jgi:hypothetical protein
MKHYLIVYEDTSWGILHGTDTIDAYELKVVYDTFIFPTTGSMVADIIDITRPEEPYSAVMKLGLKRRQHENSNRPSNQVDGREAGT